MFYWQYSFQLKALNDKPDQSDKFLECTYFISLYEPTEFLDDFMKPILFLLPRFLGTTRSYALHTVASRVAADSSLYREVLAKNLFDMMRIK
jgi:hypothetical protein